MIRTRLVATLAVLPMAAMTVAAGGDGCHDVTLNDGSTVEACTQQVWLHDPGHKVNNLGDVDGSPLAFPTWDTTEPTASVSDGAGGGYAASGAYGVDPTAGRAVFEGTFTGVLDSMDIDLHLLYPLFAAYQPDDIVFTLYIDGEMMASADAFEVREGPAETASTPVTFIQEFAVVDIAAAMADYGMTLDGEHTIRIEVAPNFINSGNWAYVFDTVEVPSGIVFNPASIPVGIPTIPAF